MDDNEINSLPLWPHGLPSTLSPSENKGTLAGRGQGTRQLKWISEHRDTISCHSSHLLHLFKRFNRYVRPVVSQNRSVEVCLHPGNWHLTKKQRYRYDRKLKRKKKENDIIDHNK